MEIQVTDAEWEILAAIWALESQLLKNEARGFAAGAIIERVQEEMDWNHRTVRTLIGRLVEKNAIHVEVVGNKHIYHSSVARQACVRVAAKSFSQRFFDGSVKSMLLHFVENDELSESDIADIRRLLSEKSRKSESKTKGSKRKQK